MYRSESIGKLVGALAKAQGSYKPLIANEMGPKGMYANLQATIDATREALSANAISFTQHEEIMDDGATILKTSICHESDQFMSSWTRVLKGATLKETGNNTSILQRRQAQMLLGVSPSKNDPAARDDDGYDAAEQHLMREVRKPKEDQRPIDRNDVIDTRQYNELMLELEGYAPLAKDIMDDLDVDSLADMPASEFQKAMSQIRRIKKTQADYERRPR